MSYSERTDQVKSTTLRNLKAEAGHKHSLFSSAEHEDSKLYRFEPGNVGSSTGETKTLLKSLEVEEDDDEILSAECISVNDVRGRSDS